VATPRDGAPGSLHFTAAPTRLAVCRLDPGQPIPGWATAGGLWSVSRSEAELSLVCQEALLPHGVKQSGPWHALVVAGPLNHELVGGLATISATVAAARIPIFAISTFDTDRLLVSEDQLQRASLALREAGHTLDLEEAGLTP
jgi:hypothetical protein